MNKWTLSLVIAFIFAMGAAPVDAQRRGPGPDRQRLEGQVEARFLQIVQRELGLDEEQGAALGEMIRDFDERRREIARRQRAVRARLAGRASLDPNRGGAELLPEADATRILNDIRAIRVDEQQLETEEESALLSVLTTPQFLRFIMLRDAFGDRVRRLQQRRGGPGVGPLGL